MLGGECGQSRGKCQHGQLQAWYGCHDCDRVLVTMNQRMTSSLLFLHDFRVHPSVNKHKTTKLDDPNHVMPSFPYMNMEWGLLQFLTQDKRIPSELKL